MIDMTDPTACRDLCTHAVVNGAYAGYPVADRGARVRHGTVTGYLRRYALLSAGGIRYLIDGDDGGEYVAHSPDELRRCDTGELVIA